MNITGLVFFFTFVCILMTFESASQAPLVRKGKRFKLSPIPKVLCGIVLAAAVAWTALGQPVFQSQVVYAPPKTPATPPTESVGPLIASLSSDSSETRRVARLALLAMGPEIQPQLQWSLEAERGTLPANDLRNFGHRYAIAELAAAIDHLNELRHSTPSMITLHFTNAPMIEILRSFGSQIDASVSISSWPEGLGLSWVPAARGTLVLDRVNYWDALRATQRTFDLNPNFGPGFGPNYPQFYRRAGRPYPDFPLDAANAVVAGPFLIAPTSVENKQSGVILTLQAVGEPKLGAPQYEENATVRLDEVTDERGESLLTAGQHPAFTAVSPENTKRTSAERYWRWKVPVQLPSPVSGRRIATIKGRFGVATGPPGMDIVIADLTRAEIQPFEFDGVIVTVTSVRKNAAEYVAGELSAPSDSPLGNAMSEKNAAGELEHALNRLNSFGLIDADGRIIRREVEFDGIRSEGDRVVITWKLKPTELTRLSAIQLRATDVCNIQCVPAALKWSTPSDTRWLMVPFELHGIQ
jgi:hypothetical protein